MGKTHIKCGVIFTDKTKTIKHGLKYKDTFFKFQRYKMTFQLSLSVSSTTLYYYM